MDRRSAPGNDELRQRLRTLDALIDHLVGLDADADRARLAQARDDRRSVLREIAERIRRDEWPIADL